MKNFHCDACGNPVYFENVRCERCSRTLGVLPELSAVSTLEPIDEALDHWQALAPGAEHAIYRRCANYATHQVCNWMVPAGQDAVFCAACRLNTLIPNLERPGHLRRWARLETGKRRLLYSLLQLGLRVAAKSSDPARGLAFAFVSSLDAAPDQVCTTGHANGLITINIDEADPAARERTRLDLDERYRTLIGHFRHEIGHYYWEQLISPAAAPDSPWLEPFRALFGDERRDYAEALATHHRDGPPADWQSRHISAYASSHPWEDWAESWAHYLHIVDTLETAAQFGVGVAQPLADGGLERSKPEFDPYQIEAFEPILSHWIPLTFALNSLNRSMGISDPYPFVISGPVKEKLAFVHRLIRDQSSPPAD